jgi:plastocyanin
MLVLAATVAAPALSAAQDAAAPAEPAAGSAPEPPVAPPPPAAPAPPAPGEPAADKPGSGDGAEKAEEPAVVDAAPQPAAPAAPAAPPPRSAPASKSASATVSTGDNFYSPASVSVVAGDSVTWRNTGVAPHSATANDGSFDTGVFNAGQNRSVTFDSPGTFSYFCTVHGAAQSGTVRVSAAPSGGGNGGGGETDAAVSGPSEAAAVASADAAGSGTFLPATGFAALGMGAVGLALLCAGIALERPRPRLYSIY